MTYTLRPAKRENTPLIIGIGGPTKSGKTYSALRLAMGLADGAPVVMVNAEGPRGHQYADKFKYLTCDLTPPFRPTSYTEALREVAKVSPGACIVDSGSHMHDGPGGVLEWHEEILDRIAGKDYAKRQRSTFLAWVEPKAAENQFIYEMLGMKIPIILCFRAKEKLKIVPGREPIDLGWQPIAGERVAFETIFTLMLPPHSKGVPDLSISDMREPFDTLVPAGKPIDEALGKKLVEWARGSAAAPASGTGPKSTLPAGPEGDRSRAALDKIRATLVAAFPGQSDVEKAAKAEILEKVFGVRQWSAVEQVPIEKLEGALVALSSGGVTAIEAECIRWKDAHAGQRAS